MCSVSLKQADTLTDLLADSNAYLTLFSAALLDAPKATSSGSSSSLDSNSACVNSDILSVSFSVVNLILVHTLDGTRHIKRQQRWTYIKDKQTKVTSIGCNRCCHLVVRMSLQYLPVNKMMQMAEFIIIAHTPDTDYTKIMSVLSHLYVKHSFSTQR